MEEMSVENIKLYNGDCLEIMKEMPDKSVDMILCDLPYGTTKCKWDTIIPFEPLWEQYNRIIKDNGAIVLFGSEPFSSLLRCSNLDNYRYDIIWEKSRISNFMFVKKQIGKCHENISIFYKRQPTYNPQMSKGEPYKDNREGQVRKETLMNRSTIKKSINNEGVRYPRSVIRVPFHNGSLLHPTQKPVDLLEWLIKTYSNEGELVLDNTMGSGSTGVACLNTNRRFIGIEKDENYFKIAKERIEDTYNKSNKFKILFG